MNVLYYIYLCYEILTAVAPTRFNVAQNFGLCLNFFNNNNNSLFAGFFTTVKKKKKNYYCHP